MTINDLTKWAHENGVGDFELVLSEVIAVPKEIPEDDDWHVVLDIPTCALFVAKDTKEIRLAVERSDELEKFFGERMKYYPKEDGNNDTVDE